MSRWTKIFELGTAGLEETAARQVATVTIASLAAMVIIPTDVLVFAALGEHRAGSLAGMLVVAVLLYGIPLLLLARRRPNAAKTTLALLLNADVLAMAYLYGAGTHVQWFFPVVGLLAFLMFDRSRPDLLALFVALPALLLPLALVAFDDPSGLVELRPETLQALGILNALFVFAVTCFVVYVFFARLERAEERVVAFSEAVSEFLDPMLVRALHDRRDLAPHAYHLTAFFADLASSTRLSFVLDETHYGALIDHYVREMERLIKASGAYIEDISGDGIFGYFGNFETQGPAADAQRAFDTAVSMQRRLRELVPEFRKRYGLPGDLYLRIGIAAGPATAGKSGAVRLVYTANGGPVNLAAKLQDRLRELSPTGGILLDETTARLLPDRSALEAHRLEIGGRTLNVYLMRPPEEP